MWPSYVPALAKRLVSELIGNVNLMRPMHPIDDDDDDDRRNTWEYIQGIHKCTEYGPSHSQFIPPHTRSWPSQLIQLN